MGLTLDRALEAGVRSFCVIDRTDGSFRKESSKWSGREMENVGTYFDSRAFMPDD